MRARMGGAETTSGRARRAFLATREIPALVVGTALAEPAAARRVLGARYGGRAGFLLAVAGLALAAPSVRSAVLASLAYVVLGLAVGLANRRRGGHTTREVQRLALWTALTPLGVAALVRLAGVGGSAPLFAAALVGQALLWRALAASKA
jgi:hypothetical protein